MFFDWKKFYCEEKSIFNYFMFNFKIYQFNLIYLTVCCNFMLLNTLQCHFFLEFKMPCFLCILIGPYSRYLWCQTKLINLYFGLMETIFSPIILLEVLPD